MNKILAIFAHPDDEAFGPGGTIALWARQGKEVHILCVTRGHAGTDHADHITAQIRTAEFEASTKTLGVTSTEFLEYLDGKIGNIQMNEIELIIQDRINQLKPDTLLTFNLNGVSGHLDHIAVASATTQAFKKTATPQQLYYYTVSADQISHIKDDYFIYVPDGINPEHADQTVDISSVWDTKVTAMRQHHSQLHDVNKILARQESLPKEEYFLVRSK